MNVTLQFLAFGPKLSKPFYYKEAAVGDPDIARMFGKLTSQAKPSGSGVWSGSKPYTPGANQNNQPGQYWSGGLPFSGNSNGSNATAMGLKPPLGDVPPTPSNSYNGFSSGPDFFGQGTPGMSPFQINDAPSPLGLPSTPNYGVPSFNTTPNFPGQGSIAQGPYDTSSGYDTPFQLKHFGPSATVRKYDRPTIGLADDPTLSPTPSLPGEQGSPLPQIAPQPRVAPSYIAPQPRIIDPNNPRTVERDNYRFAVNPNSKTFHDAQIQSAQNDKAKFKEQNADLLLDRYEKNYDDTSTKPLPQKSTKSNQTITPPDYARRPVPMTVNGVPTGGVYNQPIDFTNEKSTQITDYYYPKLKHNITESQRDSRGNAPGVAPTPQAPITGTTNNKSNSPVGTPTPTTPSGPVIPSVVPQSNNTGGFTQTATDKFNPETGKLENKGGAKSLGINPNTGKPYGDYNPAPYGIPTAPSNGLTVVGNQRYTGPVKPGVGPNGQALPISATPPAQPAKPVDNRYISTSASKDYNSDLPPVPSVTPKPTHNQPPISSETGKTYANNHAQGRGSFAIVPSGKGGYIGPGLGYSTGR